MYQEDNDSGYGTAATLAGLAALASPMGRQVRQAGKNLYMNHFGSPFGNFEGLREGLGKVGGVLRKDVARGTGGLSELGAKAYSAAPADRLTQREASIRKTLQEAEVRRMNRAGTFTPDELKDLNDTIEELHKSGRTKGFSMHNTGQDARDTWNMLRDALRSAGTMAQGTPGAIKNRALDPTKLANAAVGILPEEKAAKLAEYYAKHPLGQTIANGDEDVKKLFEQLYSQKEMESPLQAHLLLEKMRAAQV